MLRKVGKINNLNDMIKFIPKEIIDENLVTIERFIKMRAEMYIYSKKTEFY